MNFDNENQIDSPFTVGSLYTLIQLHVSKLTSQTYEMTINGRAQGEKQLVYLESVDGLEALDFFLLDKDRKMKDLLSKSIKEVEINAIFKGNLPHLYGCRN